MTPLGYELDLQILSRGHDGKREWFTPRVGVIPPYTAVLLMSPSSLHGSDVFYTMHAMRSDDLGATWSQPIPQPGLGRTAFADDVDICPCDMVPGWHAATGRLLALGNTACYRPGEAAPISDNSQPIFASYAVYDEPGHAWSQWRALELPDADKFYWAAGGAAQRVDLPDGDVLWPMYCMSKDSVGANFWKSCFFATVVRCRFDGETLTYIEHGDELTVPDVRGLCEPSLTVHQGRHYMTLRNDVRGYVTTSEDGLRFGDLVAWRFDDGTELGSYNTQQHWVTHSDGLLLVYTRRGADNDHVFRHRAPLFMAQVDPERLCVVRSTERVLMPDKGGQFGNGGVCAASSAETWVTDAESMLGDAKDPMNIELSTGRGCDNRVYLGRILWDVPNHSRGLS